MSDLSFSDKNHVYTLDGNRIPCVSDLCRFLTREVYSDAPKWQLEAAADRGTKVHAATEKIDKSGSAEIDSEYVPYLSAYVSFLQEHDVSWQLIEYPDYHREDFYAGTIDRFGMVDGIATLLDIKTTYTVHKPLCGASLNLYRRILESRGIFPERLMILHLRKDGTYKLVPIQIDNAVALALITLHTATAKKKRRKKNE